MEKWKDIKNYEGIYQISNYGNIRSLNYHKKNRSGEIKNLKIHVNKCGYHIITLNKNAKPKTFKVHRLVAQAFINNVNKYPQVNHKDGNKLNNHVNNLEWCNNSYNIQHSFNMGLQKPLMGDKHGMAILTESQVKRIKWIAKNIKVEHGYWTKLSKSLNVRSTVISGIIHNRSWKHIEV